MIKTTNSTTTPAVTPTPSTHIPTPTLVPATVPVPAVDISPGNDHTGNNQIISSKDAAGRDGGARLLGYIRVSTREQNEARQVDALREFGVDEVFMDKQSGKDFARPAYCQLLSDLRPGDVLVVKSIDRLGRNYEEIL